MEILYDIKDIQTAVDSINENSFLSGDRLVKLVYEQFPPKPITNLDTLDGWNAKQLSDLTCVCSSYLDEANERRSTGCFNALERINRYLYAIRQNLTTVEDIVINNINELSCTLELSSALEDVQSSNTMFSLTDFNEHVKQSFDLLSSFYDTVRRTVLTQNEAVQGKNYELTSIGETALKTFAKKLINYQNCRDSQFDIFAEGQASHTSDFLLKYNFSANSSNRNLTTLIDCSDILYLLSMFISLLQNTKYVVVTWMHKKSQTTTQMAAYANVSIKEYDDVAEEDTLLYSSYSKTGTNISLIISPWAKQNSSETTIKKFTTLNIADVQKESPIPQNYAKKFYEVRDEEQVFIDSFWYRSIILDNLVYDNASGAQILQNIPVDIGGSNGIFANELTITENKRFFLKLEDVQDLYQIFPNKIISRKSLLNAIDYIFIYWLENMSVLNYQITTCHTNCHENSIESRYDKTVTHYSSGWVYDDGYLRFTNSCGCSTILAFSTNLYNQIPAKYRTRDLKVGSIFVRFTKGNFEENTNALEHFYVNGSSYDLIDDFRSQNQIGYKNTGIQLSTNAITVSVVQNTDSKLKDKEKTFCLHVELKARYSFEKSVETSSETS